MKLTHALPLILISLTLGCMKDNKSPSNESEQHVIEMAQEVLEANEIPLEKYPLIDVSSLADSWIVIFSEESPHPPGTDITVHISKKDKTTSLIKGE